MRKLLAILLLCCAAIAHAGVATTDAVTGVFNPLNAGAVAGTTLTLTTSLTLGTSGNLNGGTNTVEVRNGTSAQKLSVYNTGDTGVAAPTNYERLEIDFGNITANTATISTRAAGTGTARGLNLNVGATNGGGLTMGTTGTVCFSKFNVATRWCFDANGHLMAQTDNTYDIGATAATRPRTVYAATSMVTPKAFVTTTQSPLSNAACTAGEFTWDTGFLYLCTATGVWKRVAITGGY